MYAVETMAYESQDALLVGIGDVSRMLQVAPHTLRFWEKEFEFYLKPPRTIGKQRRYDSESIDKLRRIHHLLKDVGYSIAGAKRLLKTSQPSVPAAPSLDESLMLPEPLVRKLYSMLRGELEVAQAMS